MPQPEQAPQPAVGQDPRALADAPSLLIPDVAALRLPGVPAGQPGWAVEWTVVARAERGATADGPALIAVCYEVVAGRRFGQGPKVVALAELGPGGPILVGAKVMGREQWGDLVSSPLRFQDLGPSLGVAVVYAPISGGSGRFAVLRRGSGRNLDVLLDRQMRGITDVRLEDRNGDGFPDLVVLPSNRPGETVTPFDPGRNRW